MKLLRGGTVVDVDTSREADVVVEGDRIVAVGDADDPDGAVQDALDGVDENGDVETVDVSGQVVAPGLVDAHVHIQMDGGPDPSSETDKRMERFAYQTTKHLRDTVEAGVTTVRDLGAAGTVAIDAARAVADGTLVGPRVVAAGQNVVMTGGHGHWFGREADGEVGVRRAAREQLKKGADVLKCMATGGVITQGAKTGAPELTRDEIAALVDAASAKGVPTAAHAHGDVGIRNAVEAGITSVEHGTFMSLETAERMVETDTYWVPTVSALHGIVDNGVDAGLPEEMVSKGEEAGERFQETFENAREAGVTVAMGTDAGTPFNFHGENAMELQYMVDHGTSHEAAFEAATVTAAELCGLDDIGKVRAGWCADLVVLEDDPSEDVTAYQEPQMVFARGEQVV